MFNKKAKQNQDFTDKWLIDLEIQLERLESLLATFSTQQVNTHNRVVAIDYTLEIHEMDLEYLKANMKTKKKGNK
jgi:hypothetical protein